jgi:glycosyltransferase involved in cell wall biosynthesis
VLISVDTLFFHCIILYMTDITIIMPFLNEGREPLNTIDSILSTTTNKNYEFILINDDPNDPEFIDELDKYKDKVKIQLIKNDQRYGCHHSRCVGIKQATTPYIITMDAHMRFIDNGWLDKLFYHAQQENKTIFSALTVGVKESGQLNNNKSSGCDILFKNKNPYLKTDDSILSPKWRKFKHTEVPAEVPCVMGACYIMSRDWINYIKRQEGLVFWGSTEACISLKSWLMGGSCKLIPDAIVGHIYRKKGEKLPWTMYTWFKFYNKMYLIYTLFPFDDIPKAFEELGKSKKFEREYNTALKKFRENQNQIEQARNEYQKLLVRDIHWYIEKFNYGSNNIYNTRSS